MNCLQTIYRENKDYSINDQLIETSLLFERGKKIDDFLDGKISDDELLSVLESQDFDIDNYLEEVEDNLLYVSEILPNVNHFVSTSELAKSQNNYFPNVNFGVR